MTVLKTVITECIHMKWHQGFIHHLSNTIRWEISVKVFISPKSVTAWPSEVREMFLNGFDGNGNIFQKFQFYSQQK